MPIYEYECENCGTRFERLQSMQDEPIHQCPRMRRLGAQTISSGGNHLQGSGWYITDSRKSNFRRCDR